MRVLDRDVDVYSPQPERVRPLDDLAFSDDCQVLAKQVPDLTWLTEHAPVLRESDAIGGSPVDKREHLSQISAYGAGRQHREQLAGKGGQADVR